LDIKDVFTAGLVKIQAKLKQRFYAEATALAQDLASIFSIGIEDGPLGKPGGAQTTSQEQVSPSKHSANDIRERRKLAKRIIKAVQPQLEIAVRAEADLTKKSGDKMIHDLEALLEACLHSRQPPVSDDIDGVSGQTESKLVNKALEPLTGSGTMDVDLHDEDAPGEEVDDAELYPSGSIAGDAGSILPLDGDVNAEAVDHVKITFPNSGLKSSDTPPDTNGYHPALEHHQPPPPTPPVSNGGAYSASGQDIGNGDHSSFLTDGGKPWYLKNNFDIEGSVIREVQWTGRDVVRGMSEELSEMDDDELKGMGEEMEGVECEAEDIADVAQVEAVPKTKKAKAKKRWRGYR
jgi:NuA3 HAT complex component NTO1